MQICFWEITEEDLGQKKRVYNYELINIIEDDRKLQKIKKYKIDDQIYNMVGCIDKSIGKLLPDIFKMMRMDAYIVHCYISGKNNVSCDGFAYISKKPVIVVSANTDIISVLYHEYAHIVVDYIVSSDDLISQRKLEQIVEMVEYLLCEEKLPKEVLPNDEKVISLIQKYKSAQVTLEKFIKSEVFFYEY